jgi:hypothetical protein
MATYLRSVVTLHARLPPSAPPRPELSPLVADLRCAMSTVAATLRSGTPVGRLPPLRRAQLDLAGRLGYLPAGAGSAANPDSSATDGGVPAVGPGHAEEGQPPRREAGDGSAEQALVLVTETDLIVNAVDTLGHLLHLPSDR